MSTKFFTNTNENTLLNKFIGVFSYNTNIKYFDAVVAYFRTSGYIHLKDFLRKLQKVRILAGINVDKLISDAYKDISEYFANSKKIKEEFLIELKEEIQKANYDKETEESFYQLIDDLIEKKIEIKAHPQKNIHAKVYIFRPEPFNEHTPASVITGSSNFTAFGLGTGNKYNYEFNVQLNDYDDVKFATDEFEKLWAEAIEILPVDIKQIKKDTYLNDTITPFELYIKLLIDYFDKNIDYDPDSLGDLPHNFKKLAYQIDAVNDGFNILLKYNGFVLADVVGLGKTVIATMVAKKFLIKNGRENTKILVVYPPALEKNWKNTFRYFDIDKYAKFISNGSLDKIEDTNNYWSKEEYDLVIVDEAHKFRNHKSAAFQKLQLICKSQRINKGNIEGKQKKVILVTATPLNNKPEDIFYQIQLFQDTRQSDLPITNLTKFFNPLIVEYKSLKGNDNLDLDKLRNIYKKIRKNIIQPITIRRTRKDLENIPQYKNDLIEQGIKFPKVVPPKKIEYLMDEKLNKLFDKTVFYLTDKYKINYARYRAIYGLKDEIADIYYETAKIASQNLALIMKTLMIKRLESSFYAFKKSLTNFQKATDLMIEMFKKDKIFIAPDTNIIKIIDKGWSDEEIEDEILRLNIENDRNNIFYANHFKDEYIKDLEKDKNLIDELLKLWNQVEYDPKLNVFLNQIDTTFFDKKINKEGKLVIFTESLETVNYLTSKLQERGRKDVLAVSANNRNKLFETIMANFDANIDVDKQRNDYNIIISTEVLSEGINLHRSNVIIHYDTPWNSIKLLQRIGRVNRIGTKADTIYNFVFYPSAQGDSQINLNKRAIMKIQAFHTAYGEDNQIYSEEEILDEVKLFSKKAIKEEEDERLKYLHFLRNFKKENYDWFEKIKKLPIKSRTCRNATEIGKPELKNFTAIFLKTERKLQFYKVNSDNKVTEITPLEAFKIFEAKPDEKSYKLIKNHYLQVNTAIKQFETEENTEVANFNDLEVYSALTERAKKFLAELLKYPQPSDKQKDNIRKIIELINIGRYTNLQNDIIILQKNKLNINQALIEIDNFVKRYNIEQYNTTIRNNIKAEKPILIISESFE